MTDTPAIRMTVVEGATLPLPIDNLDTDQIMPKQFLHGIDKGGLADGLLHDLRFDSSGKPRTGFVMNDNRYRDASIMLGGRNFGCGSSREHAVWGLRQYGFAAVIAPSFAQIFYSNAVNNRLLPVRLTRAEVDELVVDGETDPASTVCIDIEHQRVHTTSGRVFEFAIDAREKTMIVEGLDMVDLTLASLAGIEAFERMHRERHPWAFVG